MKRYLYMFLFSICSIIPMFAQTEFWDEYFENSNNNELQGIITTQQGVTSTIRRTEDGYDFPTKGTYRILTIFVNIIYDGSPEKCRISPSTDGSPLQNAGI